MLLHGVTGSWRIWRPVLTLLETAHDLHVLTLPGHRGGATLPLPLERERLILKVRSSSLIAGSPAGRLLLRNPAARRVMLRAVVERGERSPRTRSVICSPTCGNA